MKKKNSLLVNEKINKHQTKDYLYTCGQNLTLFSPPWTLGAKCQQKKANFGTFQNGSTTGWKQSNGHPYSIRITAFLRIFPHFLRVEPIHNKLFQSRVDLRG